MTNLDKIIEYLHYHQGANRRELMDMLNLGVKDTQMKALLSEGIAKGDIRMEGKARATRYFITPKAQILRTVNLDSYYAVETDKREMLTAELAAYPCRHFRDALSPSGGRVADTRGGRGHVCACERQERSV